MRGRAIDLVITIAKITWVEQIDKLSKFYLRELITSQPVNVDFSL